MRSPTTVSPETGYLAGELGQPFICDETQLPVKDDTVER